MLTGSNWNQNFLNADVTKHFGRGGSHVTLPWDPCVGLNRAIQLWWNKTPASLSSVIIVSKPCSVWICHCSQFSFPQTPRRGCLQIAIVPSFLRLRLDTFQKTRAFYLLSCCEEISSLMAFKTGNLTIKTELNKKKVRIAISISAPSAGHIPYVVWGLDDAVMLRYQLDKLTWSTSF